MLQAWRSALAGLRTSIERCLKLADGVSRYVEAGDGGF